MILITSDQHRADTLGGAGHPCVRTPHLDQLAREGVRFDRAYTDCPICIPARTTLITGRQAHRNGIPSYAENRRLDRAREHFLGSLITRAGYQTELVGKKHWHAEPDFRAGFEHVVPLTRLMREREIRTGRRNNLNGIGTNEMHPTHAEWPIDLYSTNWLVDRALDRLAERERAQPLFLWLSLTDPHPPFTIHEPYYSMYRGLATDPAAPAWAEREPQPLCFRERRFAWDHVGPEETRDARAAYFGLVTNIDHQLGRLFSELREQGLWDEALVIYSSDHGELLGDAGMWAKSSFLDASARVPFIAKPPASWGAEPGRAHRGLVEWADILPTLCEAAGADIPGDVTGRSLVPILRGEDPPEPAFLHGQHGLEHMYHDGRYKYLYFAHDGAELLFDTEEDPEETTDLAARDDALRRRLREALATHLEAEGNDHAADGDLLNRRDEPRPANRVRARTNHGWLMPAGGKHMTHD